MEMSLPIFSVVLTHTMTSSVMILKLPEVLKISRVLPILKPTKNPLQKSSYRPISNLHTMEKVFEQHVKKELEQYFYGNKIIVDNHHGGRHNRSTMTAKAVVDAEIAEKYEEDKVTAVVSSDLSNAFETVDHFILLDKLEYYGVEGPEKEFLESYFKDRMQFVEINTKRSRV